MFRALFKLFIIGTFVWLILGGITAYLLMQERTTMRGEDLFFRGKVTLLQMAPAIVVIVLLLIARGAARERARVLAQSEVQANRQSERQPARFDRSSSERTSRGSSRSVDQGARPRQARTDTSERGYYHDRDDSEPVSSRDEALERRRHRFQRPPHDANLVQPNDNEAGDGDVVD